MIRPLMFALAAPLVLLASGAAHAGNVQWSIGINVPAVTTVISSGPIYRAPPVVYQAPAPVYYEQPAPVYYEEPAPVIYLAPPQVVYRPVPRAYAPAPVVYVRPVPVAYPRIRPEWDRRDRGWNHDERKWHHDHRDEYGNRF